MDSELKPFNVREIIRSVIKETYNKIQEKNLELSILIDESVPELIVADSVNLEILLINLISNSINTTEKGEINFSVENITNTEFLFKVVETEGLNENEVRFPYLVSNEKNGDEEISSGKGSESIEYPPLLPGLNVGEGLRRINLNFKLYIDLINHFCDSNNDIFKDIKFYIFKNVVITVTEVINQDYI